MSRNAPQRQRTREKDTSGRVLTIILIVMIVALIISGVVLYMMIQNKRNGGSSGGETSSAVSQTADLTGMVTPAPATPTPAPTPEPTPTPEPDQKDYTLEEAEVVWDNNLLLTYQDGHWKALNLFGGGDGEAYIEALNTLQEKVGDGVTIYSMPAPLNSQFYTPKNALEYTSDQEECFDAIAKQLDPRIKSINLVPVMRKHTEEPIYLRTDTHWSQLGTYYAVRAYAQAAGVEYPDISEYEAKVNEDFLGSMSVYCDDDRILNDPEDFPYYLPAEGYRTFYYDTNFNYSFEDDLFWDVDTDSSYLMYMGGDGYVVKIQNPKVKNGRRMILIKDSYGNSEVPWFVNSFEEVYVVDMRYLESNLVSVIRDMKITDVLFSMSAYSVVGGNSYNLMELIEQNEGETIYDAQADPNSWVNADGGDEDWDE